MRRTPRAATQPGHWDGAVILGEPNAVWCTIYAAARKLGTKDGTVPIESYAVEED